MKAVAIIQSRITIPTFQVPVNLYEPWYMSCPTIRRIKRCYLSSCTLFLFELCYVIEADKIFVEYQQPITGKWADSKRYSYRTAVTLAYKLQY
jgi:hypothetical protein